MRILHPLLPLTLACLACLAPEGRAASPGSADPHFDEAPRIAGRSLTLNGSGVGQRFVFQVYSIALFLPEAHHSAEAVLDGNGPCRVAIELLRDVGNVEFAKAIAESISKGSAVTESDPGEAGLARIGMAIAALPQGLHKGDRLTLDWVPEVGTVIELNRKPLMRPEPERSVYKALLKVWLGAKPTDERLKERLLGIDS